MLENKAGGVSQVSPKKPGLNVTNLCVYVCVCVYEYLCGLGGREGFMELRGFIG